jgi:chromosome segregation ATPase
MSSEKNFDQLHQKLDKLDEKLDLCNISVVKVQTSLEHHQESMNRLRKDVGQHAEEMKQVQRHVSGVKGAGKLIAILGTLSGIVWAAAKFISL